MRTGTTTRPASASMSCPVSRCSARRTSSTPAPAGRAFSARSLRDDLDEDRPRRLARTEVRSKPATRTWATCSTMARSRPASATPSIRRRCGSCRSISSRPNVLGPVPRSGSRPSNPDTGLSGFRKPPDRHVASLTPEHALRTVSVHGSAPRLVPAVTTRSASPTQIIVRARASTTSIVDRSRSRSTGWSCSPAVGIGQVEPRLRHALRRGPAPLRRVAVRLRAAVPRPDGEAEVRAHPRPVADDRDRAEERVERTRARRSAPSPRSTTTCACSTRAPASSSATSAAVRSARAPRSEIVDEIAGAAREDAGHCCSRRSREPQGRVPRAVRRAAQGAASSRVRIDGMIVPARRRRGARQEEEALDRARRRPAHRSTPTTRAASTDSVETALREGKGEIMRRGPGREEPRMSRSERAAPLRPRLPRADAAELLVQLPARHVRRLQRPRRASQAADPEEWSRASGRARPHPRGRAPLGDAARPVRPLLEGRAADAPRRPAAVRTGGHFEGYQVLLWPAGAGGRAP